MLEKFNQGKKHAQDADEILLIELKSKQEDCTVTRETIRSN